MVPTLVITSAKWNDRELSGRLVPPTLGRYTRRLFLTVFGLLFAATAVAALLHFGDSYRHRLQVSIKLISYTNAWHSQAIKRGLGLGNTLAFPESINGQESARVAVLQVLNMSPFSIIRGRSPEIIYDSVASVSDRVPVGWNLIQPGKCEQIWLEPPSNGMRWRVAILCEKFGGDSYGAGPPDIRSRMRRALIWLGDRLQLQQTHEPTPTPAVQFSSGWIGP